MVKPNHNKPIVGKNLTIKIDATISAYIEELDQSGRKFKEASESQLASSVAPCRQRNVLSSNALKVGRCTRSLRMPCRKERRKGASVWHASIYLLRLWLGLHDCHKGPLPSGWLPAPGLGKGGPHGRYGAATLP
jgi:hypothetical protein